MTDPSPHVTEPSTRERILGAARRLYAQRGYAATSMRDLAEAVELTKAALYHHFASKQDVLGALLEPVLDEVEAIAADAQDGPVDRRAVLERYVDVFCRTASSGILLIFDAAAMRDMHERYDPREASRRTERALAGADDEAARMAVRCALGTVRSGVLGTVFDRSSVTRPGPGAADAVVPELSPAEREQIVGAALAAWNA